MKWTLSTDTLSLNPKLTSPPPESTYAKREVLRQASKTYDPLGLISPVTIKAKIFMQELSKSRVTPLKQLTLPQLELMAALTAARLASFVKQALEQRYSTLEIYMWSDSEIVLHWLNSDKTLKQFVANRVLEINQLVPATHWNYCPTKSNPADLLTRGINSKQLKSSNLWKDGPEWLLCKSRCPSWNAANVLHINDIDPVNEEVIPVPEEPTPLTTVTGIHQVIDISRYSTLNKLLSITAYVLRFVIIIMKQQRDKGSPTDAEKGESRCRWILNSQSLTYSKEIENIQSRTSLVPRRYVLFYGLRGLCVGRVDQFDRFRCEAPGRIRFDFWCGLRFLERTQ